MEGAGLGSGLASRDKRGPAPAVGGFTALGQSTAACVCEGRADGGAALWQLFLNSHSRFYQKE